MKETVMRNIKMSKLLLALSVFLCSLLFVFCGNPYFEQILGGGDTAEPELIDAQTPVITMHPVSAGYNLGATAASLAVQAEVTDGGSLSYQWYRNNSNSYEGGEAIPGETGKTYTPVIGLVIIGTNEITYYWALVTNTNNAVNGNRTAEAASEIARITVTSDSITDALEPLITMQPQSATVSEITAATALTVTATVTDGGTLSYQWYSNSINSNSGGAAIAGATNQNYTPEISAAGTYYYYVVVTNTNAGVNGNPVGKTVSDVAVITVLDSNTAVWVDIDGSSTSVYPNLDEALASITASHNYTVRIGSDQTMSSVFTLPSISGANVTIKSNTATRRTITLGFTNTGDGLFIVQVGSSLILEDIIIDGDKDNPSFSGNTAPLVRVNGEPVTPGTFIMNTGAVLQNNRATNGGGVFVAVYGTFNMNGGNILENTAASNGGGVYLDGSTIFSITSGAISDNSALANGGGVYAVDSINIAGGEISGNTAVDSGGGVYTNNNINITGGTISGNKAGNFGGVYANGAITLGGTAIIKDNIITGDLSPNNIYLGNGKYITLGSGTGAPATGMEIYVQTATTSGVIVNFGASSGDEAYFHADESGKMVILTGDQLIIVDSMVIVNDGIQDTQHSNLKAALDSITSAGTYTVAIGSNQTLDPYTFSGSGTRIITLMAYNPLNPVTVQLSANGPMFTLSFGVTLTLSDGVTLRGRTSGIDGATANNSEPLVRVNTGATFVMEGNSVIAGNANTNTTGGGVYIDAAGTFTKNGGTLYGADGGVNSNTAGSDTGNAAYHNSMPPKTRTNTAGPTDDMDSNTAGPLGGWDGPSPFDSAAAVFAYLDSLPANDDSTPYTLPMVFDLGDMTISNSGWEQLLQGIEDSGKFVELDLSDCTMSGTVFNPVSGISTGKDKIVDIVLPDAATSIATGISGNPTFNHFTNLKTFSGTELTSIGNYAFYGCSNLVMTELPAGLASIGAMAFQGCTNLALTELPPGLTSIGNQAFYGCTSLALTELPPGLTSIGSYAFNNCANLTLTELPAGITSIANNTFYGCTNLALTELPAGITAIANSAFYGCTNLALTELPAGITSIGDTAFRNCTSLALTELPAGITSIANNTFLGCTNLALTELPAGITSIGDNAFYGCTNLALTELPTGITSIGSYVFQNCTNLTLTELPAGITSVGNSAFQNCTNLTLTELPAGIITIGTNVFYGCSNLALTELPAGITSIGSSAFYGCSNLALIELPSLLASIGNNSFQNCTNLAEVICHALTPPALGTGVFTNTNSTLQIKVPAASVTDYQTAPEWSSYASRIVAM